MKRRQALRVIGGGVVGSAIVSAPASAEEQGEFLLPYDPTIEESPEEERVDFEWPQHILEVSEFDTLVSEFEDALYRARRNSNAAGQVVERHAKDLWKTARNRVQGLHSNMGGPLHEYDDRPVYWARLEMSRALRQYDPQFDLDAETHSEWLRTFDRLSRGYGSVSHPQGRGISRICVSGFDPFSHIFTDGPSIADRDNNPSGATMLRMDGQRFQTEHGPVVVDTVMLPVGWLRFDDGIVEDFFGPRIENGFVDSIMTISRGAYAQMQIENVAANWRGGGLGTNLVRRDEPIPPAEGWPLPMVDDVAESITPQSDVLEWIPTTLPVEELMQVENDPWPVRLDNRGTGWPYPYEKRDGPSEGGTGYIAKKSFMKIMGVGPYEGVDCWDETFYITDPSDVDSAGLGEPGEITIPSSSDDDADSQPLTGHVIRAESDAVPVTLPTWGGDQGDCESLLFVDPDLDLHADVEYRIVTDDPGPVYENVDTGGFAGTINEIVQVNFEPTHSANPDPRPSPTDYDRLESFGEIYDELPDPDDIEIPRGMKAFSGPGGNYLSNESQYRANRVRIGLGAHDMAGGHIHCSGSSFETDDQITDDRFEEELKGTVDQLVELVKTSAAAAD